MMDNCQVRAALEELESSPYATAVVYVDEILGLGINGTKQQSFTLRAGCYEVDWDKRMLTWEWEREERAEGRWDGRYSTWDGKFVTVRRKMFLPLQDVKRIRLEGEV